MVNVRRFPRSGSSAGSASVTIHTRVLILAKDDRLAGPLADGLDRLGLAHGHGANAARRPRPRWATLGLQAAVVDVESGGVDACDAAAQLKAAAAPRRLPVIALGRLEGAARTDCFDLTLSPPLHPAQAANRLESLLREAVAEEEFELRRQTFAERGRTLNPPDDVPGPGACWPWASPRLSSSPCRMRSRRRAPRSWPPSPPTRPSTTSTTAPSTRWCWSPAGRERHLSISAACGGTRGLYHTPVC
jgi:hypothetical protein